MRRFKEFVKKKKPTLITATPTHGEHSRPRPRIIKALPTHGRHSKIHEDTIDRHEWEYDHDNNHLGESEEHVHNLLNHEPEKFHKIDPDAHVKRYTDYSGLLNQHLIDKARGAHSAIDDVRHTEHAEGIDKALNHPAAILKHDLHVYHGTRNFNPGEEAAKSGINQIKLPAYTSTSISKHKAGSYAGYDESVGSHSNIIHIHLKKGQKALYIGANSYFPREKEALLPRNTTLHIHPEPTHLDNGTKVWHAHVVD